MKDRRSVSVILLAGGTGRRFGSDQPKQLVSLSGQPVLAFSLRRFCLWLDRLDKFDPDFVSGELVLVSHPEYAAETLDLASRITPEWAGRMVLAEGGTTRHLSSINGIRAMNHPEKNGLYFFHDTARPYVPEKDLDALLAEFRQETDRASVASLVVSSSETLVQGQEGMLQRGLDRNHIFAVKTPQVLSGSLLHRFTDTPDRPEFTDLLRWAELQKEAAILVTGSPLNLKLTNPEDRLLLEAILGARETGRSDL